ncbi:GNAT family N-acetyltransferase [Pedobacter metabolipauper]|uniref:Acetyltransferase (GNAT) family protein n=1 Tax=Pedobacter metabolipauper TaxID=425513 RepID=A0A4R6STG5_9SPHI|nr:GNAT family N-acetyltransferase [Pedobacter metabolipauper]TDQ08213.1 acetyltransferase (GNAT) family protein [Pedobacter metabolipauper]
MNILKYEPAFREKCIEIFESNQPKFFDAAEKKLFTDFLDEDAAQDYFVVETDGDIVGCGGIFLDQQSNEAGLSWGMIHADHHKKGIGTMLTGYRIDLMKEKYPNAAYKVDTSQFTAAFYVKSGFKTIEVIPNGFAKGLDKYMMKLES